MKMQECTKVDFFPFFERGLIHSVGKPGRSVVCVCVCVSVITVQRENHIKKVEKNGISYPKIHSSKMKFGPRALIERT